MEVSQKVRQQYQGVWSSYPRPHPFPHMVTYFQSIIGREARAQLVETIGKLPRGVYACVGGGFQRFRNFCGFS